MLSQRRVADLAIQLSMALVGVLPKVRARAHLLLRSWSVACPKALQKVNTFAVVLAFVLEAWCTAD